MSILDGPTLISRPSGILRAPVNISASGPNDVVAASTGKRIVVLSYVLIASAPTTVKWLSDTTALSGPMPFSLGGGVSATSDSALIGLLETAAGQTLKVELGTAVQVSGHLTYVLLT